MTTHALYRMFDKDGALLYVGITMDVASRFGAHRRDKEWWHDVANVTIETHPDREAVLQAELTAIRVERPLHNRVGVSIRPGHAAPDMDVPADLVSLRALAVEYWELEGPVKREMHRAICDALAVGIKTSEVAAETGYTREHIRRIRIAGEKAKS